MERYKRKFFLNESLKFNDEKVQDAIEEFAKEISKKPLKSQEKYADGVGYKKWGKIFDKLSDDDHNRAMELLWDYVKDYNK